MKALSIRQPWAFAITFGYKPVENRTWSTSYHGPLAIHAGQKEDTDNVDWVLRQIARQTGISTDTIEIEYEAHRWLGCYVGAVTLDVCVREMDSPWFFGPFGFVLGRAVSFRTRPHPGRLGIYNVPAEAAAEIAPLIHGRWTVAS